MSVDVVTIPPDVVVVLIQVQVRSFLQDVKEKAAIAATNRIDFFILFCLLVS